MTLKRRFIISYLSAIVITLSSVMLILSLIFYITLNDIPSPTTVYKMLTTKRSLSPEEESSYLALDAFLAKSPELLNTPFNQELNDTLKTIEARDLNVVIRKNDRFLYFSEDLVKKSLDAHIPNYEFNNFEPIGTLDNAGRFYHYIKADFKHLDGSSGSFFILKRESNLLEFFTKWGFWVVLLIIAFAIFAAWFINEKLKKTTLKPLEELGQATQLATDYQTLNQLIEDYPQKEVTQDVQALQQNFKNMWLELQKIEQLRAQDEISRKELIANISHDLKTPMTSIIGYVEGLQDGVANTPAKKEHYLTIIHQKALSLNELIEELFLYSNLDMKALVFDKQPINLISFLKDFAQEYEMNEALEWQATYTQAELMVEVDVLQMTRVLTNLIQNSLKFHDPAKAITKLTLTVTQIDQEAVIQLADNGVGIDEQQLSHLFERFYRGDKARSASIKGAGLGLSIVKHIIEAHNGTVTLSSQLAVGTTVTLKIPLMNGVNTK